MGPDPHRRRLDVAGAQHDRHGRRLLAGRAFVDRLTSVAVAPAAIVVLLVVAVALVHLAITNLAACMALLIPIAVTIAEAAHLNPLACGLIVTIAVDAVILYPVQTAANLLAYEAGYFPSADVRRLGSACWC